MFVPHFGKGLKVHAGEWWPIVHDDNMWNSVTAELTLAALNDIGCRCVCELTQFPVVRIIIHTYEIMSPMQCKQIHAQLRPGKAGYLMRCECFFWLFVLQSVAGIAVAYIGLHILS